MDFTSPVDNVTRPPYHMLSDVQTIACRTGTVPAVKCHATVVPATPAQAGYTMDPAIYPLCWMTNRREHQTIVGTTEPKLGSHVKESIAVCISMLLGHA